MARRGPKPEPAAVKEAKGNPGRRSIGSDPAEDKTAKVVSVAPPAWLKAEGLKVWQRLAPRLSSLKLLSQTDAETFGRYCRNFARWLKMQATLDKEGETYESDSLHGKLKRAHPAFLIGDRLERQLIATESVFGLNPAERQRIFAARAATPGGAGDADLFGNRTPAPVKKGKPAKSAPAAERSKSAIGFLQ